MRRRSVAAGDTIFTRQVGVGTLIGETGPLAMLRIQVETEGGTAFDLDVCFTEVVGRGVANELLGLYGS